MPYIGALHGKWRTLAKFSITPNGFLPARPPLQRLPSPYYAPWETLIQDLSRHLQDKTLRSRVHELPLIPVDHLAIEAEWRRAYLILTFLANGYVWGGDHAAEVSAVLGLPPVATYAGLNLWNYSSRSTDLGNVDALQALHTFTGTEDESWFYMISVAIEAKGAYVIPIMMRAIEAIEKKSYSTLMHSLSIMTECIHELGSLLDRMHEKCDPWVFYHNIRPYLAGSKNMAAAGLPRGVFYDEGNGRGEWRELRGGSNGQSSLIQFFDVVLGVQHTSGDHGVPGFHREVRAYMPGPHRLFLEHVEQKGSIGDFARLPLETPEHDSFRLAFQETAEALAGFRQKHLQMVTRYIIIPSQKRRHDGTSRTNLASATTLEAESGRGGPTGTGGTALLPFLKRTRDETREVAEF